MWLSQSPSEPTRSVTVLSAADAELSGFPAWDRLAGGATWLPQLLGRVGIDGRGSHRSTAVQYSGVDCRAVS